MRRRRAAADAAAAASPRILADLAGATITGQVAVGEHIVQIHAEQGAVVNYAPPEERPVPRRASTPVRRLPRDFPDLIGRENEIRSLDAALGSEAAVEILGAEGMGKTTLLRHTTHRMSDAPPDGVIYTVCGRQPVEDVLQFVFECLYDCDAVLVPTPAQLAEYLQEPRLLVALDDVDLARDELGRLLDALPSCTFLGTATERHLWGEGRSVDLPGLDERAALALIERGLGRELTAAERPAAEHAARALEGNPLGLLQVASLLASGQPPAAIAELTEPLALTPLLAASVSPKERQLLATVAAMPARPVAGEVIAAASELPEAPALLQSLENKHLVEAQSPNYRASGAVQRLVDPEQAESLRIRLRETYAAWAERERDQNPERVADEGEAIALLLDHNAEADPKGVLRLARAAGDAFALRGRWGQWQVTLERGLEAARRLGDQASEAWALHQLGSRALCLGDLGAAGAYLSGALTLREQLGDPRGTALSRHNLGQLGGPPLTPLAGAPSGPGWPPLAQILVVVVAGAAGVGAGIALGAGQASTKTVTTTGPATAHTTIRTTTKPVTVTATKTVTTTVTTAVIPTTDTTATALPPR
jgi:hypothetical protein